MITNMYTIYDSKAEIYTPPMHFRNDAEALRQLGQEANNPDSKLNKFAEDYSLFLLGEWDEDTAEFEIRESPKCIAKFHELINKPVTPLHQEA